MNEDLKKAGKVLVIPDHVRGNELMIQKVYAAAAQAGERETFSSPTAEVDKVAAAIAKRDRRMRKRAGITE